MQELKNDRELGEIQTSTYAEIQIVDCIKKLNNNVRELIKIVDKLQSLPKTKKIS